MIYAYIRIFCQDYAYFLPQMPLFFTSVPLFSKRVGYCTPTFKKLSGPLLNQYDEAWHQILRNKSWFNLDLTQLHGGHFECSCVLHTFLHDLMKLPIQHTGQVSSNPARILITLNQYDKLGNSFYAISHGLIWIQIGCMLATLNFFFFMCVT